MCSGRRRRREKERVSLKNYLTLVGITNTYIVCRHYTWNMKKRRAVVSFSIPASELDLLGEFESLAQLDRVSFSTLVWTACKEYLKNHAGGNPQKPLHIIKEPWKNPQVQRRRENLEWLESLIRRNPGNPWVFWLGYFSKLTGLRRVTVEDYLKTLKAARVVKEVYGKLYTKDRLPS